MRVLKIILTLILTMLGLIAAAVTAINVIPGEQFKPLIGSVVKSATGRDLTIDGKLTVDLSSTLAFSASDVRFANASWGSRPDMYSGARIEAELALRPLLQGVLDFSLLIDAPDLLLETDPEGRGNWQMGGEQVAAETKTAASEDGGLALRPFIRELRLEQTKLTYLDGQTLVKTTADFQSILLGSRGDQVTIKLDGRLNDIPVQLSGGVDSDVDPVSGTPTMFKLAGNAGDIQLNVKGTLSALAATAAVDLLVEMDIPSLAAFTPFSGRKLPKYGPLKAVVRLSGDDGDYSITDLKATLDDEALSASVEGSIADLAALSGIDVDVNLETAEVRKIIKQADIKTPFALPDRIKAQASLSGSLEKLSVTRFQTDVRDKGVQISADGEVEDAMALKGIKTDISLKANSLASLSKYTKMELPSLGPVKVTAKVASRGKTYAIRNIKAKLADKDIQATLEGSIGNALGLKEIDANAKLTLTSLASLNKLAGQNLPDSGPVSFDAKLINKKGLKTPSKVSATMTGDGLKARVHGNIANLLAAQGIAATIEVEASSLRKLGKLAGKTLENDDPLTLKGQVQVDTNRYAVNDLKGRLGEKAVTGAIAFTQPAKPKERPRITGKLHLGKLDLSMFGLVSSHDSAVEIIGPGPDADVDTEKTVDSDSADNQTTEESDRIFSDEPLPVELLTSVDADLKLTADEVLTHWVVFRDLTTKLSLDKGLLSIEPVQADVGNGTFQGTFDINVRQTPALLSVDANLDGGTFRNFGGQYFLRIDLESNGNSIAELMAELDGQIIADARDLDMEKSAMTNFGRGLFDSLDPFDKEEKTTKLICAVARFDINDGIAVSDDALVAQMTKVTWFGGGQIDLKTEQLDLGAKSKPRTGLGIQLIGGLSSLVQVGGTLAQPRILLDPKGVAKVYGEQYLNVATAGLYYLGKRLWDKSEANSDVCAEVLALEEEAKSRDGTAPNAHTESHSEAVSTEKQELQEETETEDYLDILNLD